MVEVSLREAGINLQQCRCLIEVVTSRRAAAIADARLLNDDTVTIAAAIDEVISAVQFHDITRQQVEHVQRALHSFCDSLAGDAPPEIFEAEAKDLCRIQAAQLRHTKHELVAAVRRIITSLRGIAPAVKHLAHKTHRLSATTERTGSSLFSDIDPVLTVVTGIIDEADLEGRQVIGAVSAVLDVLNELSQLLRDIESIGIEMKMISLNAGITAAHHQERGAGLGVIARSIQTLSSEVLSRTNEFTVVYGQLERLASELNNGINAVLPQEGRRTTQLTASASAFMARLQGINLSVVQLMAILNEEALSLATDVVATADKITIHVEAGKVIDQLVADLDALADSIAASAEYADEAKILELMTQNYTMQSERRVHAGVRHSSVALAEVAGEDRTGLGVNVELF
jgi:methyl-accepting chemotaxis protein